MVDHDLIIAKAGSIKKHLRRIAEKSAIDLGAFLKDIDRQEIISFNLHLAIENCTDLAAHIISEEGLGVPGSASEMFYILEENGYLSQQLTEKMIKAVGLRNLIVHEYSRIDLKRLYEIIQKDIKDIDDFVASIFQKLLHFFVDQFFSTSSNEYTDSPLTALFARNRRNGERPKKIYGLGFAKKQLRRGPARQRQDLCSSPLT